MTHRNARNQYGVWVDSIRTNPSCPSVSNSLCILHKSSYFPMLAAKKYLTVMLSLLLAFRQQLPAKNMRLNDTRWKIRYYTE